VHKLCWGALQHHRTVCRTYVVQLGEEAGLGPGSGALLTFQVAGMEFCEER
jgi:hypothetical protein